MGAGGRRLDEVWVSAHPGDPGRRVFALPPESAPERLVDLSWSPDGRHLLVIAHRRSPEGARRSRLIWLDTGGSATTGDGAPARDLASLPADVVPGSYTWSPAGDRVALLTRAGEVTALGVVDTAPAGGLAFTYIADVDRGGAGWVTGTGGDAGIMATTGGAGDAGLAPPGALPALAWSPDGHRLVFASRTAGRTPGPASPFSPLTALGRPGDLPGLYVADVPAGSLPAVRPIGLAGAAPGWRPDGSIVALTHQRRGAPPALRRMDDTGRELGLAVLGSLPGSATYRARWDGARPQGLVAVAPGGRSPALPGQVEHWLVRFGPVDGAGAAGTPRIAGGPGGPAGHTDHAEGAGPIGDAGHPAGPHGHLRP